MSKVLSDLSSKCFGSMPDVLIVPKSWVLCMTSSDITEAALVADHATSARIMSIVALDNRAGVEDVKQYDVWQAKCKVKRWHDLDWSQNP